MSAGTKSRDELERRIAELEQANARLAETARRAAEIAETAPDALIVVDEEGLVSFVNRRVPELFGLGRKELLGRPLEQLLPERYRRGHERHLRHYFSDPKVRAMGTGLELWARRADGSEFPVEISLSPIRLGDRTLVACSIRDASERRAIERRLQEARARAEAATEEKTRFIAAASHDLRQPLQAAAIYLELLTGGTLEPEASTAAAVKARACVDALRLLLNKVLHISKLDAGAVTARHTDFPVQSLFDRLSAHFQPLAAKKGLELRVRPTSESATSDPILVAQILENFVSNAVRYTESGGLLIGCRRRGGSLCLQVWDTGVGIPAEEREKVFNAFYRASGEGTDQEPAGIGLGLTIAGELAALLDHPLGVRSRHGRGSVFEVVLPRAEAATVAPRAAARRAATPAAARLALVDDNPAIVDALKTVLEVAGHSVIAATSTEQLMAELGRQADPPDLLVTDFRLAAGENGLDAIERLRAAFDAAIPAIVLTGDSSFETLERKAAGGGYRVLAKPVDAAELLAAVDRGLAG